MAYVIMHQQHGLYLGSNAQTHHWSFIRRSDHPPAVQTFATIEAAIQHITHWTYGNIPSAYIFSKIEDHGSGYVFEHEAVAQGYPSWSCEREDPPAVTLFATA